MKRVFAWLLVLIAGATPAAADGPHAAQNKWLTEAARARPRTYPRSWRGEALYWTVVGAPDADREALLSDEGALEPRTGGFSIEPFLFVDGERVTARDAVRSQQLEEGDLPIPSVRWDHPRVRLRIRAFAPDDDVVLASYRVENPRAEPAQVALWLALRPMQVLPTWQFLNLEPGFAPIHEIAEEETGVVVDGSLALEARTPPVAFGAAARDLGDALDTGVLPQAASARDADGLAAGALAWRFTLAPGAARTIDVCAPLAASVPTPACRGEDPAAALTGSTARWRALLGRVEIELPGAPGRDVAATARAALGHILVNRDGPRLQPGSRNYERSWIRDGSLSASALVAFGHAEEARTFLAWYAPFQLADGAMPCCVDRRGADPTPEHDSTGAFLFALGIYTRFTDDVAFVRSLWPRVERAVAHLEALRAEQLAPRFREELGGATWGILPASISHEGYAKHPVHSYWDDLFARQGLRDAVFLARRVGDGSHAAAWSALDAAFEQDLRASYEATRRLHDIPYLAGSVELGDFDPTATAVAFELGGEPRDFPGPALDATFARYLGEVRERMRGVMKREAYAPYELRIANALIRMGRREDAWDVFQLMLDGRRPRRREAAPDEGTTSEGTAREARSEAPRGRASREPSEGTGTGWRQWPEIVWMDETRGQWLGDLPHGWIDATFLNAVRTALVYERASDQALVVAGGVPPVWLADGEPLRVARLPTWWGPVDYTLRRERSGALHVRVGGGLRMPPGGVVVAAPGMRTVTLRALPADFALLPSGVETRLDSE